MKKDNFITYIFLGIIFFIFIMYPINYILINKKIIKPTINNTYTIIDDNNIESKFLNLKNNINTKLSNYLFLFSEINQLVNNLNHHNFLYQKNIPYGENSGQEFIFKLDDFYILQTNKNNEYIDKNIKKNTLFYNNLSQFTNLYIYLPSRYEFYDFNKVYNFKNMNEYLKYFKSNLNEFIKVKELNIKNEEEYKKLFYKTDHHWNAFGALIGYFDICEMFGLKPLDLKASSTDLKYIGSIGKKVMDQKTNDYFSYIVSDLKYEVKVENDLYKPLVLQTNKGIYYDHYVGFYNGLYNEVIIDYKQEDLDNLLIIGDSYAWSIDYIIASHFNKTYILNPKYLENINIKEYLEKNNISKTLILMETQTTLYDNYDYQFIEKLGG